MSFGDMRWWSCRKCETVFIELDMELIKNLKLSQFHLRKYLISNIISNDTRKQMKLSRVFHCQGHNFRDSYFVLNEILFLMMIDGDNLPAWKEYASSFWYYIYLVFLGFNHWVQWCVRVNHILYASYKLGFFSDFPLVDIKVLLRLHRRTIQKKYLVFRKCATFITVLVRPLSGWVCTENNFFN